MSLGNATLTPGEVEERDGCMLCPEEVQVVDGCMPSPGEVEGCMLMFCACLQNFIPSSLALMSSFSSFVACLLKYACVHAYVMQCGVQSCLSRTCTTVLQIYRYIYIYYSQCIYVLTLKHCLCACVLVSSLWRETLAVSHSVFQVLQPHLPKIEGLCHSWLTLL